MKNTVQFRGTCTGLECKSLQLSLCFQDINQKTLCIKIVFMFFNLNLGGGNEAVISFCGLCSFRKIQMHLVVQERKKISGLNVHERQKLWLILQFAVII